MHTLFTIGHSNHPIEKFMVLLRQYGVEVLVDVRSAPISSRNPQFNRDNLKSSLEGQGIRYLFLGKELGARRKEMEAYEGETASYERIARLPAFLEGLERIKSGLSNYTVALMCAEKDPLDCHRTLLVCRHLRAQLPEGIKHILADGRVESQSDLEKRLVVAMEGSVDQTELFGDETEPVLERSYRKRGSEIAYRSGVRDGD